MALQRAVALPQAVEKFSGKVPALSQGSVQHWRRMALAQDEAVSVLPLWVAGIVAQDAKVEGSYDIRRG
jgi:hypothetical protein